MIYQVKNGAMVTTAALPKVAVSTIKTMLQLKVLVPAWIVEWGYSLDGTTANTPGSVELIDTSTVFATSMTQFAAADIDYIDGEARQFGDPTSNYISVGTSASGFTAGAEGTITASKYLAGPQLGAPTSQFIEQFPLGQEPYCVVGNSIRIRMTFGTSVSAYCYIKMRF